MSLTLFISITKTGIDLQGNLGSGRSLMHLVMNDIALSTFALNSGFSFEKAAPFPWHLQFWTSLAFMRRMWTHFRKKLTEQDFARIAHLQPDQGWSPLCLAASVGETQVIRNCISMGADMDFEGSPHGSALIVASACGQIGAVRILVRAGASLSYRGETDHRNVFTFCRSKVVRSWLLLDRFTEQRMLDVSPHWGDDQRVSPRAGAAVARLKLVGDRAKRYRETLMDYAKRLAKMRKDWRGKAIPPICMSGIVYGSEVWGGG